MQIKFRLLVGLTAIFIPNLAWSCFPKLLVDNSPNGFTVKYFEAMKNKDLDSLLKMYDWNSVRTGRFEFERSALKRVLKNDAIRYEIVMGPGVYEKEERVRSEIFDYTPRPIAVMKIWFDPDNIRVPVWGFQRPIGVEERCYKVSLPVKRQ